MFWSPRSWGVVSFSSTSLRSQTSLNLDTICRSSSRPLDLRMCRRSRRWQEPSCATLLKALSSSIKTLPNSTRGTNGLIKGSRNAAKTLNELRKRSRTSSSASVVNSTTCRNCSPQLRFLNTLIFTRKPRICSISKENSACIRASWSTIAWIFSLSTNANRLKLAIRKLTLSASFKTIFTKRPFQLLKPKSSGSISPKERRWRPASEKERV